MLLIYIVEIASSSSHTGYVYGRSSWRWDQYNAIHPEKEPWKQKCTVKMKLLEAKTNFESYERAFPSTQCFLGYTWRSGRSVWKERLFLLDPVQIPMSEPAPSQYSSSRLRPLEAPGVCPRPKKPGWKYHSCYGALRKTKSEDGIGPFSLAIDQLGYASRTR